MDDDVERSDPKTDPAEMLDRVLDKGIVVGAWVRSADQGGIDLTGPDKRRMTRLDIDVNDRKADPPEAEAA